MWLGIVLASLAVASVFLTTATKDFVTRAVVTTIETTTASLQVSLCFAFLGCVVKVKSRAICLLHTLAGNLVDKVEKRLENRLKDLSLFQ